MDIKRIITEAVREQINESPMDIWNSIAGGAAAGVILGTAAGAIRDAADTHIPQYLNKMKFEARIKRSFHPGAEVVHIGSGKRGKILKADKEPWRYHIAWDDGSISSHYAGNDSPDAVTVKEWK